MHRCPRRHRCARRSRRGSPATQQSRAKSSREKVRAYRERMRAKGLQLVQMWVSDAGGPQSASNAHRQSGRSSRDEPAAIHRAWAEALTPFAAKTRIDVRRYCAPRRLGRWVTRRPQRAQKALPENIRLWPRAFSLTPAFLSPCSAGAIPITAGQPGLAPRLALPWKTCEAALAETFHLLGREGARRSPQRLGSASSFPISI